MCGPGQDVTYFLAH